MLRRFPLLLSVLLILTLAGCATPAAPPPGAEAAPGFHAAFARRVDLARAGLPAVIAAAERAAAQTAAATNLLITVPYGLQNTFAEELLNRSGGLANALPVEERARLATPRDIGLFSVSSWEEDGPKTLDWLRRFKTDDQLVVLFASAAGAPADLPVDFLVDNGAVSGNRREAALNTLANTLNGWLWCLEYTAALSRLGLRPGIIQGMLEDGAAAHNAEVQPRDRRNRVHPAAVPLAPGRLAALYLRETGAVLDHAQSPAVRAALDKAADLLAGHLRNGGTVGVASCTHFLLADIHKHNRSPWTPFNAVWQTRKGVFEKHLKPGDYMVWFGYTGLSTVLEDYGGAIRNADARLVASYSVDLINPNNNARPDEIVIPQSWALPDAAVPLPFPPGHMGPVSGLESGLLYRLLDEAVAARLGIVTP